MFNPGPFSLSFQMFWLLLLGHKSSSLISTDVHGSKTALAKKKQKINRSLHSSIRLPKDPAVFIGAWMLFLDVIKSPDPKNRMNSLDIWLFRFFFSMFCSSKLGRFFRAENSAKRSPGSEVILYVNSFCKV